MRNSRRGAQKNSPSIVVVGHPSAPIGMGEHVRSVFRSLTEAGGKPGIVDIYGPKPDADEALIETYRKAIQSDLGSRLNIFCINGDEVADASTMLRDRNYFAEGSRNVIYPAWELEKYPSEWAKSLNLFDEIWAPSRFIKESIEASASRPVVLMPLACEIHARALRSRPYFGIRESAYCFFFSFDFLSYIERKNPFAVIEAFNALLDRLPYADVQLVIKANNIDQRPEMRRRFEDAISDSRDRIIVIDRLLDDLEMKSLVWLVDCFVSLHRSEGFGRGMSEAMVLGKPVIATAYSGNMDFCSAETALLVPYKLVPVRPGSYPHWQGQFWAEADIDAATDLMVRLVADPTLGYKVGWSGRQNMKQKFSFLARGVDYLARSAQLLEHESNILPVSEVD